MAKKKTENIKAAPVLRAQSGGGDQPTPTPEQTGTRTYQIMDPWKDRDVVNLVDVKAVDGEITEVKVNGQPAGGGGGGDMLVANATYAEEGHDRWYQLDKTWTEISNAITTNPDSVMVIFGGTHFGLMAYRAYTNNYGLHIVQCYTWYDQASTIDFSGGADPSTPLKYIIE